MAVTISLYDSFKEFIGDGTIDLDGHSFKVMLLGDSASFSAGHSVLADVSGNQISAGGGFALAGSVIGAYVFGAAWEDISVRRGHTYGGGYGSGY
ncbi:MAG: hypothetical protein AB7O49_17255 [Sphingomonadales bacterium]